MNRVKQYMCLLGLGMLALTTACSEQDTEITSIEYARLFSPLDMEARVVNRTNISLNWKAVQGAVSYDVELYYGSDDVEVAKPFKSENVEVNSCLIENLLGSTAYLVRVRAVGEETPDSKWASVSVTTQAEQIFESIEEADVEANSVTLHWDGKGNPVTRIVIMPGNVTHELSASEISDQSATIAGLTGETSYTANIYYADTQRGTIGFETWIDATNATKVNDGDDLKTVLDNASDGADIAFTSSATFELGSYSLKKSFRLFSVKPTEKATIIGKFVGSGVVVPSVRFAGVILNGDGTLNNLVDINSANSGVETLEFKRSEIRNYTARLAYNNNATAAYGTILFDNCVIDNIEAGGDAFDFRTGTLTSLTLSNSTISNGIRSLLRCQIKAMVTVENCTFYALCTVDNKDNAGLFRMNVAEGALSVSKSIFYGIGSEAHISSSNPGQGVWARASNLNATATYSRNYYFNCPNLWAGKYSDDHSAVATELDSKFVDAANGDFTVQDEDIKYYGVGDPRWIK
ncbi:MAG: fibronectin type III domain-containing protein [Mediterranea sp.]|jgi:hypothetical protein|nr:fibronectin type III domain-containing protein [Mediterranea sp.]